MIQYKQPKKIKGARKKTRQEIIERLQIKYPTWFEGKSDKEIKQLISFFKVTGMTDEEFPTFCIKYEANLENLGKSVENAIKKQIEEEYEKYLERMDYK